MNGGIGKLVAVAAVLMMVAIPLSVISDSTSAADDDYTRYYYNQLNDDLSEEIYNKVLALNDSNNTVRIDKSGSFFTGTTQDEIGAEIQKSVQSAINALMLERPETYWINMGVAYTINYTLSSDTVTNVKFDIVFEKYSGYPEKSVADAAINSKIESISIDKTTRYSSIKSIHDYLANNLTYSSVTTSSNNYIRSVYTALAGDGNIVCEGYAKSFKMICDANDIPCIIIAGDANGSSGWEGHMYNYVKMTNGAWYLVDVTWDDQVSRIIYDYMLQGSSSVAASHLTNTTTGYGFNVPALSENDYLILQEKFDVTFNTNGGSSIASQNVVKNEKAIRPSNPEKSGFVFNGWYSDSSLSTEWDWNTLITKDVQLYAKWSVGIVTHKVIFDTDGDTVQAPITSDSDGKAVIGKTTATLTGFSFNGWNTKADGTGKTYNEGDVIDLDADIKLYAQWTELTSESDTTKTIEELTAKVEKFLDESLIEGVNNKVLLGGAGIAILVILSLIIILRKH